MWLPINLCIECKRRDFLKLGNLKKSIVCTSHNPHYENTVHYALKEPDNKVTMKVRLSVVVLKKKLNRTDNKRNKERF